MIIESTNYVFIKELDINKELTLRKSHHRLGVFYHKGTECSNPYCDAKGTRLIVGKDKGGGIHIDVYTHDLKLMTVDHIKPKSLGGNDKRNNKMPLCSACNTYKGNNFCGLDGFTESSVNAIKHPKAIKKKKPKINREKMSYARRWRKVVRRSNTFNSIEVDLITFRLLSIHELRNNVKHTQ